MTTARIVALLSVVAVVTAQYPAPTAYGGGGGYSAYGAAPTMSYGAGASSYGAARVHGEFGRHRALALRRVVV
eukprot:9478530-Pyramimonas_sp.AAC.1